MEPTHDQKYQILAGIKEGKAVTEEQAHWAVKQGYAQFGEDGDIDLTQKGRDAYDANRVD
ncbi:hypothetical protein ARC20_07595 [Stenotrophomonas panacihumi]|uniref:Uncharacterized protein n=1 Tax=Stenotrophomonas panacihumi TaxID=676599 RepID=A0A0R0ASG8_9GAMM|nr:hypothetical protein [Stenotrophomonas panacihumi]KRG45378.1 hypothetical protein ARC20_07595 [Stenotrophomonas panacihumi]PTN54785.1 hypothetical protein C9J98_08805 [Stenotrophomonas panacihumi]